MMIQPNGWHNRRGGFPTELHFAAMLHNENVRRYNARRQLRRVHALLGGQICITVPD
jgi:hypothetical protein